MTQLLGEATINELEGELQGSLVRPGDDEYEEARHIWNGAIDRRPTMIVRPANTADVVRVVRVLGDHDTVADALRACDIAESRWPSFVTALASLEQSHLLREAVSA